MITAHAGVVGSPLRPPELLQVQEQLAAGSRFLRARLDFLDNFAVL